MLNSIAIVALSLLVISVLWRFSSKRRHLPCPTWLGWLVELDNPLAKMHKAKNIVHNLSLEKGMTVLDVGCGPGRVTIPIAIALESTGKVVAMDMQKGMLDKVQKKASNQGLTNIHYHHAAIGAGTLERDAYDRIVMVAVLGEIPNQEEALQEIYGALKAGGQLSITETIFDPHYQRLNTILKKTCVLGFKQKQVLGGTLAYTLNLEKTR